MLNKDRAKTQDLAIIVGWPENDPFLAHPVYTTRVLITVTYNLLIETVMLLGNRDASQ